jgi:aspartate aminotransferase
VDADAISTDVRPRRALADIRPSPIRLIADSSANVSGVIPLWYGEGDRSTPDFIIRAATASLARGETFYSFNAGLPELREAIADYQSRLSGTTIDPGQIVVTGSGMSAIVVVLQALIAPGDEVVVVGPIWPNVREAARVASATVRDVFLQPDGEGGWRLALKEVEAACAAGTRVIFINSPNNPTGWTASREEISALLAFARRRGLWIVADEVYNRIVFDGFAAPSILDAATPDDPVVVVQSFSKAWAMTGWRMGWIVAPPRLSPELVKLVEFNTSCAPVFVQRAGVVAIREGEEFIADLVGQYRRARDLAVARLAACERVKIGSPQAAFYAFFAVEGESDSIALAQRLVRETRVGLAPGVAFGAAGEGWLRLCFAAQLPRLELALDRLLSSRGLG